MLVSLMPIVRSGPASKQLATIVNPARLEGPLLSFKVRSKGGYLNRAFPLLLLTTASLVFAAGIENPSVEHASPSVYRLVFTAVDAGSVEVCADNNSDTIDSPNPVVTVEKSPVELRNIEIVGRAYFHLKPARGRMRTVATRQLPLEGAANFRDLGGYRTKDGRYVRWGKVYRSGNLAGLTDSDYNFLEAIHLKLICDVRTQAERKQQQTKWQGPKPAFLLAPIGEEAMTRNGSANSNPTNARAPRSSGVLEKRGYEELIVHYAAQYEKVFHRLAAGDVPLMVHCSSGRDRTGMFAALFLHMLGVPRETVIQDYLLTEKYLPSDSNIENKIAYDIQESMGATHNNHASLRTRFAMKREVMDSTFRVIDERYGSFNVFRRTQLHISDAELGEIRAMMLEF